MLSSLKHLTQKRKEIQDPLARVYDYWKKQKTNQITETSLTTIKAQGLKINERKFSKTIEKKTLIQIRQNNGKMLLNKFSVFI